jgi:hypothetical protein
VLQTKPPSVWLKLILLSAFLLVLVFLQGLSAGGLDVAEACALRAGQPYDHQYHSNHPYEQLQLFPLTSKCNAAYDLVPPWINPTLAILALLTASFFVAMLVAMSRRLRSQL